MLLLTQARRTLFASLAALVAVCLYSTVVRAQDSPEPTSLPAPTVTIPEESASPIAEKKSIEVIFAIDCSDSMAHAMEPAKKAVEAILKNLAREFVADTMRVGFIRYGDAERRYTVYDFTTNKTTINRLLTETHTVKIRTEYVGAFIRKAVAKCSWSSGSDTERRIYIIGNESADDGPVDYRAATLHAAKNGISVHAVYCPLPNEEFVIEQARRVQQLRLKSPEALPEKTLLAVVGEDWIAAQNTWLLMAYIGGGECYKVDFATNTFRKWTPSEVQYLVEVVVPREFQIAQEAEYQAYLHNLRQSAANARFGRR